MVNKNILLIAVAIAAMVAGIWMFQKSQFDFVTLDGDKYRWQDLQGEWVVVNYFAEWCAPCLKEIPELNAFANYAAQTENVSLFAISYDALPPEELQQIKQKYDIQFDLIDSREPKMLNQQPQNLPATFIISPEGKVLKQLLGEQTNESLQSIISALKVL